MLHVICTWLHSGHLSIHVGDSLPHSEEIVKISNCVFNAIIIMIKVTFLCLLYGLWYISAQWIGLPPVLDWWDLMCSSAVLSVSSSAVSLSHSVSVHQTLSVWVCLTSPNAHDLVVGNLPWVWEIQGLLPHFPLSSHTTVLQIGPLLLSCQMSSTTGSDLGLVGLVLEYCDLVRQPVWCAVGYGCTHTCPSRSVPYTHFAVAGA